MKREHHFVHRIGWLRAAVLGANDGIVSTASLLVGVASASVDHETLLLSGVAGLVAGAMSMAAGEFVSVSSQADTEKADLDKERRALEELPEEELEELAQIYVGRGVEASLAREVASQLMDHDDLGAHARDELGISDVNTARPYQAAVTSAGTFSLGAALPLIAATVTPRSWVVPAIAVTALLSLAILGTMSARAGGARVARATLRVVLWGALAMAVTAGIGTVFGTIA
ncbi:MAG: VIT family protein [Planctomycetota bacterium]